ncbi:Asd/ArgC dimerization domain-containing protein [Bifidobacterium sp. ESL0682]|uniref:N-acetyl-gamma-glutamyl-phosphate reductase n=1 Tax=Bifidobacterium sp. ESL0682 TaxID=2983212 RepID=UPI0023F9DCB9|nr:Asd/ArgC dimerization domain-containing protein [Bifidobacterium sp. ESL0682]WEV41405.1 Asd/ArgC dimerization domain-containing protein [Bifidobacterium sp. ESL0682]
MGRLTVAVAGASGYAGGEMLRILAEHPSFEVTTVTGDSSAGDKLGKHVPHIPVLKDMVIEPTTPEALNGHDIIVLALPHGVSGALAEKLHANRVIVDLGADHRLESSDAWAQYYGGKFHQPWVYGMPELIVGKNAAGDYICQREKLLGNVRRVVDGGDNDAIEDRQSTDCHSVTAAETEGVAGVKFVAGPGCNVTAVTLAFQPAVAEGLVQADDIVADLAVGYSGAGKNLKRPNLLAAEAFGSAMPYSVGGVHRHIPEIVQNLAHAACADMNDKKSLASSGSERHFNQEIDMDDADDASSNGLTNVRENNAFSCSELAKGIRVGFTPILVPMSRGILAVVSAKLSDKGAAMGDADIRAVWLKAYEGQRFIQLLGEGEMPVTANVLGSNTAEVQVAVDRCAGRLYGFAAIDNLNRGTAGQAVQSLNIALGLPEDQGLTTIGVTP